MSYNIDAATGLPAIPKNLKDERGTAHAKWRWYVGYNGDNDFFYDSTLDQKSPVLRLQFYIEPAPTEVEIVEGTAWVKERSRFVDALWAMIGYAGRRTVQVKNEKVKHHGLDGHWVTELAIVGYVTDDLTHEWIEEAANRVMKSIEGRRLLGAYPPNSLND